MYPNRVRVVDGEASMPDIYSQVVYRAFYRAINECFLAIECCCHIVRGICWVAQYSQLVFRDSLRL
jgi:hypothetical protein